MCWNYKVSLITFLLGVFFSIGLITNGNKKYLSENKVSGIFLIFISLIQLLEFIFWIDIKNEYGINKIATIIGPLINAGQPIIFYLIKYIYYKPDLFTLNKLNLPVALLNLSYFIYFINTYIKFISEDKLITSSVSVSKHLIWPWLKYYNPYYFIILFAINIFYLFNINYAIILSVLTFLSLYASNKLFKYSVGEMWCFFGSFIPLIMFVSSYYVDILVPFTRLKN